MGTLARDADSPQRVSALSALLRSLNFMYDYPQNYISSLTQSQRSTSDPSQGLAYPARPKQKQKSFNPNSIKTDKQLQL